jgi:hypothetical protein
MSYNQNQSNIYPKSCNYGCNTQIYWNTSVNEYWEVFTKKKHICPNRVNNKPSVTNANTSSATIAGVSTKPTYYNKKPCSSQPKPKMSNSFELLTGPIETIQKNYEILSDIVTEHNGKVHGSQSHMISNNSMSLIVYYEVPQGQRDEVKQKFNNFVRNNIVLQKY